MRFATSIISMVFMLLASSASTVMADASVIYKWQDDQGRTLYSDTPPEDQNLTPLKLPELNVQPAPVKPTAKSSPSTEPKIASKPQEKVRKSKSRGVIGRVDLDNGVDGKESSYSDEYYEDRYPYYYPPYPSYRYKYPRYGDPYKRYRPCQPPHKCERRSEKPKYGDGKNDQHNHEKAKHKQRQKSQQRYRQSQYGRNTQTSYGEFERPNLYWDPYPYNSKRYGTGYGTKRR